MVRVSLHIQLLHVAFLQAVFLEYVSFAWHAVCMLDFENMQRWPSNKWATTIHCICATSPAKSTAAQPKTHIGKNLSAKHRFCKMVVDVFVQGTSLRHLWAALGNRFSWPTDAANMYIYIYTTTDADMFCNIYSYRICSSPLDSERSWHSTHICELTTSSFVLLLCDRFFTKVSIYVYSRHTNPMFEA